MVRLLQILVVYFSEIKFKSKLLKKNPVWMNNANKYASHSKTVCKHKLMTSWILIFTDFL